MKIRLAAGAVAVLAAAALSGCGSGVASDAASAAASAALAVAVRRIRSGGVSPAAASSALGQAAEGARQSLGSVQNLGHRADQS